MQPVNAIAKQLDQIGCVNRLRHLNYIFKNLANMESSNTDKKPFCGKFWVIESGIGLGGGL